jgi:dTDP-4-dehydrorhamnose 3,5-epimerase
MQIIVTQTALEGVVLIDTVCFQDERGFFIESWHLRDFAAAGLALTFVQDGHSQSRRGVLRGLHYQDMTAPMGKLIRCTAGEIFDVAVDLRVGSPTFGRWLSASLSAENKRQIYIPPGFAHGFEAIGDVTEVQYRQTNFYTPAAEATLAWDDPDLAIAWPLAPPTVSARDRRGRTLGEYMKHPAFRYGETA